MIDTLLRDLRQPEYIHVLINPLPIYGLAMAWVGLIVSLFLRSRRAQIATLAIVLISAVSAWPVYALGQQSYDRVLSMADSDGQAWLDEHQDRAEDLIYFFYALALLSAVAIVAPAMPAPITAVSEFECRERTISAASWRGCGPAGLTSRRMSLTSTG